MLRVTGTTMVFGLFMMSVPTSAQTYWDLHRAVDAAIISDIVTSRQAEREARRAPYLSSVYGSISTAAAAQDACSADVAREAGRGARIDGQPHTQSMASGWEVEGFVLLAGEATSTSFVCSVRNGSVSGVVIDR